MNYQVKGKGHNNIWNATRGVDIYHRAGAPQLHGRELESHGLSNAKTVSMGGLTQTLKAQAPQQPTLCSVGNLPMFHGKFTETDISTKHFGFNELAFPNKTLFSCNIPNQLYSQPLPGFLPLTHTTCN